MYNSLDAGSHSCSILAFVGMKFFSQSWDSVLALCHQSSCAVKCYCMINISWVQSQPMVLLLYIFRLINYSYPSHTHTGYHSEAGQQPSHHSPNSVWRNHPQTGPAEGWGPHRGGEWGERGCHEPSRLSGHDGESASFPNSLPHLIPSLLPPLHSYSNSLSLSHLLTAKQFRVGGDQGGASFPGERRGH